MAAGRRPRVFGGAVPGWPRGHRGPAGWGRQAPAPGTGRSRQETGQKAEQDSQKATRGLTREETRYKRCIQGFGG